MSGVEDPRPVLELDPSVYRQFEAEQAAEQAAEFDDFDAFWRARNPVKPARIRGEIVTPPIDMPLHLIARVDEVQGSSDEEEIRALLAAVYGAGIVDRWTERGMGLREYSTVLAWTGAHMRGEPVDFETAAKLAEEAFAQAEGKASNRAARRAQRSRKKSGGTGA